MDCFEKEIFRWRLLVEPFDYMPKLIHIGMVAIRYLENDAAVFCYLKGGCRGWSVRFSVNNETDDNISIVQIS